MATIDYSLKAENALKLIKKFGTTATINITTTGTYNPVTDTYDSAVPSTETANIVFTKIENSDVNSSVIKKGDRGVLIASSELPITPDNSMTLTADSVTYKIVNVTLISPSNYDILYKAILRK